MTDSILGSDSPGTTPIGDVSGLIPRHIHTRAELNAAEAINISKAVNKYLAARPSKRTAPFTLSWAYRLHREMFGEVWRWAGQPRRTELNLGAPFHDIDVALQNLLDDLVAWRQYKTYPLIEQAVRFHHRAVHVHPFLNGNGRWSRLLANILLKQERAQPTIWPEETIGTASVIRADYLAAIRAADNHDFDPLIELHRRFTPGPV
jgi:Fic-DOC domain mobile mystery protein B